MWGKVWDVGKSLSCKFEVSLTITDSDEEVLESSFGFVTEHVCLVLFCEKFNYNLMYILSFYIKKVQLILETTFYFISF